LHRHKQENNVLDESDMDKKRRYKLVVSMMVPLLVIAAYLLTLVLKPDSKDQLPAAEIDGKKMVADATDSRTSVETDTAVSRAEIQPKKKARPLWQGGGAFFPLSIGIG
jgi:hypothetical protein